MSKVPEKCDDCGFCVSSNGSYVCKHDYGKYLDIIYPNERYKDCPLLEEVLDSIRYRVRYREQSLYLTVVFKDGKPWEVFAEHPTSGDITLYYMMSSLDSITRLTTMALKVYPIKRVINQLVKSSRTPNDFPGILADKLNLWTTEEYHANK